MPSLVLDIRTVTFGDFEQWLSLWDAYNKFYGRIDDKALAFEITKTTWERFLDPKEPVHALVAESEGQLVGLAHYLFHRNTSMIGYSCYLQDLYAQESLRGQGIGRALIRAVYEEAKKAGSTRVYWQTHETNLTAMKLYDKMGERSGFVVYRKDI